jgi:hypothetical protein
MKYFCYTAVVLYSNLKIIRLIYDKFYYNGPLSVVLLGKIELSFTAGIQQLSCSKEKFIQYEQ